MITSDIAAVAIIVVCGLLGMKGCFRWASGLIVGLILGSLLLGIIGMTSRYDWSGRLGSFFENGTVASYMGEQLENIADRTGIEVKDDTRIEE